MTHVSLRNLVKQFGTTRAVDGVSLEIAPGELFFLLGPSGCGKTTLLRMLAGFTDPTSGGIFFGEQDVTHLPPEKRHSGMVFQGYVLWPHMTVAQNVAFGLEARSVRGSEKEKRVARALDMVQMGAYAQRRPNELSGGQQQRVALARALVIEPTVLLLDEPLSNLDAKLRLDMREQIREVCKRVGITGVYVTHDQKEALSMADRIAVLRDGKAVQVGPPRELYTRPRSRFVADFLGETNFVPARIIGRQGESVLLESVIGPLRSTSYPEDLPATGNVTCSLRPEALSVLDTPAREGFNEITAVRRQSMYLGEMARYQMLAGSESDPVSLKVFELNPTHLPDQAQEKLTIRIAPRDVVILQD